MGEGTRWFQVPSHSDYSVHHRTSIEYLLHNAVSEWDAYPIRLKKGERDAGSSGSLLSREFKGDRCIGHDDEGLRQAARVQCAKLYE